LTILDPTRAMRETITVKRVTSQTSAGDPVRGSTFVCAARVQRQFSDLTSGPVGQSRYGATVFAPVELRLGDLLFFLEDDAGNLNAGHAVVSVDKKVAFDGATTQWKAMV
jgi:hypothetical protein